MTAKPHRRSSSTVGRDEVLRDSRGRVIDNDYVEGAVEDAVACARGRGRPSLSKSGESPLLRLRVPQDLDAAIRDAARSSGVPLSAWVRRALREAVIRNGRVS
jgi:hypothetical protein